MMNGATISRARRARNAAEPTTIAPSQAQTGTRRRVLPKPDLGEPTGDLPRLVRVPRDPHLRCGLADVEQHRVSDGGAPSGLLQRRGVELGDPAQVVLAAGELGTRRA